MDTVEEKSTPVELVAAKEKKYRRLLSISGTRFIARTRNLRIFNNRPAQIRTALKAMGLGELADSLDSRFQATVSVLYTVLCPISELSQALQSPELNLLGAQDHLQLLLSQMTALRTSAEFENCILRSTESVSSSSNSVAPEIPVLLPQRKRRQRADLSDFVVMQAMPMYSSAARRKTSLDIAEYYEIIDLVKQQIHSRFDNPALGALSALQQGQMTPALKEFCELHRRDPDTVERQLKFTFLALKANQPDPEDNPINLQKLFRYSSLQPELHYITVVALTLPVTSSCAERAFSRLRLVKSHLRTTMSSSRLQSLLRVSANKPTAVGIQLDCMVAEFCKVERRIVF
jgi:hypothetical protein